MLFLNENLVLLPREVTEAGFFSLYKGGGENPVVERRKLIRFKAPFYFKYSPNHNSLDFKKFSGIAKDVNMKGIRISLDKTLDVNSQSLICLYLFLPDKILNISAKVVWTKDNGNEKEAGIYFINMPDIYKEDIFDYIFKYYPQELTRRWWQM